MTHVPGIGMLNLVTQYTTGSSPEKQKAARFPFGKHERLRVKPV